MSTTAIAIRDDQTTFDDLQRQALVHIGVQNASPADLAVFFHTCKRTGLDPFARQIYMIQREGKQTMQTGIDGLRLVAQRTTERTRGSYGYEDTQWCDESGQWRDVWLSAQAPAAAKVTVIRDGQRFPAVALYSEFVQRKRDGNVMKNWSEKPALMLAKCAEAAALRKAFPMDLSGIYTPDELHDEPAPRVEQPHRQTGLAAVKAAAQAATHEPVEDVQDAEVVEETGEAITTQQLKALHAGLSDLGIGSAKDRPTALAFYRNVIGREVESSKDMTRAEASYVLDAITAEKAHRADAQQPADDTNTLPVGGE